MALEQWPPYLYRQPGGEATGLDLELAQAILKEAGCALRILPELPTTRRQRVFEQGGLDLLLAASDTPERRAFGRFSAAYRFETVGVFTRAERLARYRRVRGFEAIAEQKLALLAPRNGWYGAAYARALPRLEAGGHLSTFNTFQQGVRMLDAGRADLILGDGAALRHEAREQGVAIAPLPFVALRAPVHLMLNKASTSQAELDAINGAIGRLEQQGVLAAIRARYGEQ
jgi:polar amino acid transport system substrate-binding protein